MASYEELQNSVVMADESKLKGIINAQVGVDKSVNAVQVGYCAYSNKSRRQQAWGNNEFR